MWRGLAAGSTEACHRLPLAPWLGFGHPCFKMTKSNRHGTKGERNGKERGKWARLWYYGYLKRQYKKEGFIWWTASDVHHWLRLHMYQSTHLTQMNLNFTFQCGKRDQYIIRGKVRKAMGRDPAHGFALGTLGDLPLVLGASWIADAPIWVIGGGFTFCPSLINSRSKGYGWNLYAFSKHFLFLVIAIWRHYLVGCKL